MILGFGSIIISPKDIPPIVGDIPTWLASLTAVVAIVFGYRQLKQLNVSLKLNSLAIFLQIENEMNSRKVKMLECARALNEAKSKATKDKLADQLTEELKAYLCLYLNSVDRLAFCIRRKYIPESEAFDDYRDYFTEVISSYPEYFGADTKHRNVKYLYDHWNQAGLRLK